MCQSYLPSGAKPATLFEKQKKSISHSSDQRETNDGSTVNITLPIRPINSNKSKHYKH
jgi:hypothetical protein